MSNVIPLFKAPRPLVPYIATALLPDGSFLPIEMEEEPTWQQLRTWIGGPIVRLAIEKRRNTLGSHDITYWGDEEGMLKSLPINHVISRRLGFLIVGPIVAVSHVVRAVQ